MKEWRTLDHSVFLELALVPAAIHHDASFTHIS